MWTSLSAARLCQPFSVVGSQRGKHDDRDGFPAFLSAMRRYEPKLAVFENVRGMLYRNREYFEFIRAEMRDLGYAVSWRLLNAVNFGVPQNRERLVVVAHRKEWMFPAPNNAQSQVTVGRALAGVVNPAGEPFRFLTESMDKYVATYEAKSKCHQPARFEHGQTEPDGHLSKPFRRNSRHAAN